MVNVVTVTMFWRKRALKKLEVVEPFLPPQRTDTESVKRIYLLLPTDLMSNSRDRKAHSMLLTPVFAGLQKKTPLCLPPS